MTPVVGFAGYSGSGKTTLIEQVIGLLVSRGLKVSLIKHAHHAFDVDVPGKDSWRHRQAGAHEVLVSSSQRWALMHEHRGEEEPSLDSLVALMAPCDLIIVEGYKQSPIPKIEVWRRASGLSRLEWEDSWLIAVASDESVPGPIPCLDVNNPESVALFLVERFNLR